MGAGIIREGPSLAFLGGSTTLRAMAPTRAWGQGLPADLGTWEVSSSGRERGWGGG